MPSRTFRRLLGETALERKCRFLCGSGILVVVAFSFVWCGQKIESLLIGQTTQAARMLVTPTLMNLHYKLTGTADVAGVIDTLWGDLSPLDNLPRHEARFLNPYNLPKKSPPDEFERSAVARFLQSASADQAFRKAGTPRKDYTFADATPMWAAYAPADNREEFRYVQAVLFKPNCLNACHGEPHNVDNHMMREVEKGKWVAAKAGDLAGVVSIRMPMEQTRKAIHSNRAILITAALLTAIAAMIASSLLIRYVVVVAHRSSHATLPG